MAEAVERINRAADLLLNQGESQEGGEIQEDGAAAPAAVYDEDADLAPEEALEGARIVNVVEVREEPEEEAENPPAAAINEAQSTVNSTRSEYARRMVPPEPVSVQTTNVGDGKRIKTIIYRRRSNSLD